MDVPRISVVITAHNRKNYLEDALKSVIVQFFSYQAFSDGNAA